MSRASRKLLRILSGLGRKYDYLKVERTHAGRNQRADGWAVWVAVDERGRVVCGSQWPLRDLRVGHVVLDTPSYETAMCLVPK